MGGGGSTQSVSLTDSSQFFFLMTSLSCLLHFCCISGLSTAQLSAIKEEYQAASFPGLDIPMNQVILMMTIAIITITMDIPMNQVIMMMTITMIPMNQVILIMTITIIINMMKIGLPANSHQSYSHVGIYQ